MRKHNSFAHDPNGCTVLEEYNCFMALCFLPTTWMGTLSAQKSSFHTFLVCFSFLLLFLNTFKTLAILFGTIGVSVLWWGVYSHIPLLHSSHPTLRVTLKLTELSHRTPRVTLKLTELSECRHQNYYCRSFPYCLSPALIQDGDRFQVTQRKVINNLLSDK